MIFNSPIFLFAFLPLAISLFIFIPLKFRNIFLVLASLLFYSWGEGELVFLLLISIFINYISGLLIHNWRDKIQSKIIFFIAVSLNIGGLAIYKYTNFFIDNLNIVYSWFGIQAIEIQEIYFPLGISFFTFQALSYLIDVYREEEEVETNPINTALYLSFFPKLISGPIIKYSDMKPQFANKQKISLDDAYYGISRFIQGLAKKILIADNLGIYADQVFSVPANEITGITAWGGALIFGLQLFFDFSGYTDMAIGLGRLFGFKLPENFDYPYISQSISDFWRRWHKSLSFWFRDYFYTPLALILSRNWNARFAIAFSVFIAFVTVGLWHGAAWKYVVFGAIHASFLVFEMTIGQNLLSKLWRPFRHIYAIIIIVISTIYFRADSIEHANTYLAQMFFNGIFSSELYNIPISNITLFIIPIALFFAFPIRPLILKSIEKINKNSITNEIYGIIYALILLALLIVSFYFISSGHFQPFIYFQF